MLNKFSCYYYPIVAVCSLEYIFMYNETMNLNCGHEMEPQMLTIINKAAGNVSKKHLQVPAVSK